MASIEEKAAFLDKVHLFRRMEDDPLFAVAEKLGETRFKKGETIIERGKQAEIFYLIYNGKVRLHREGQGQKDVVFVPGDYFGAEALLPRERRHSLVLAEEDLLLFTLTKRDFDELEKDIPYLKKNLQISVSSRRLIKEIHFDWVRENEVIYFLTRKHPLLFWRSVIAPIFLLGIPLGLVALISNTIGALLFTAIPIVVAFIVFVLWVLWRLEDWRNDYYIVTNQRVIWIEKIIGIHDSRQEAPLTEILSVDAELDFITRMFDYGNVNVRTFVGNIHLRSVHHPYQARHIIEELWDRSKIYSRQEEKEALKKAILERLENPDPTEAKKKKEPKKEVSFWRSLFPKRERRGLKLRYEQGKTITYRKHWIVLLRQAGLPGVLTLALSVFIGYQLLLMFFPPPDTTPPSLSFISLLALAALVTGGWMIYQYVDWSNDIFQVSEDKIYDIDRKPLGSVESRSAPLDNIQSIEYRRIGIWNYLFNYGTVYIEIGTADFAFEDVLNPAAVQQDIDNRRLNHINKAKAADAKKERDRIVNWLLAYHQSSDDFKKLMDGDGIDEASDNINDIDIY
ncbi:MAG: hypothetical protein B6I38_08290 [Anaerolineaceae bacterium 4572_5.1]|nr:MAG: hypothetical protein B5M51_04645 [Anaerolinea sp. 4484_236]OQY29415.1 MAG: hypothetical protein B6I38_08290 [Anaerolineaceae bacterium 4572_5.1]